MIIILGGGPAGRIAAIRLSTAGRQVTLVESGGLSRGIGGQCLHYGCMPVCALNDAARFIQQARSFQTLGITGASPAISFPALVNGMQEVQKKIAEAQAASTGGAPVPVPPKP